jgi:hypothetical protein
LLIDRNPARVLRLGDDGKVKLAFARRDDRVKVEPPFLSGVVVCDKEEVAEGPVAADRIGHAAMRCAALLAELADNGQPVDRVGTGVVVEVYPAASMRRWDITSTGYQGSNGKAAVDHLRWAAMGAQRAMLPRSDR